MTNAGASTSAAKTVTANSILALETSGPVCSVCLEVDGTRFETTEHVERKHNELLLRMIDDVFTRAECRPGLLTAVAFSCGPGSFTGVRIAAAATQAIALAVAAKVVRVPSSTVLVQAALRTAHRPLADPPAERIITAIRSRGELYYLAMHRCVADGLECLAADAIFTGMPEPGWFRAGEPSSSWLGVGDSPPWWGESFGFAADVSPSAADVCTIATRELRNGEGLDPASALPVYVDGDSPWQRR